MTADSLPHTPRRPTQEHTQQIPISPIVLEIERQLLFTPDRPGAHLKSRTSLDGIATYACQGYNPRPDDFYFDDGVTKLELPDDEREVVVADEFLKDIRKLEDAIELVQALVIPQTVDHLDTVKLEEIERVLLTHIQLLETYERANYRTLRDACMGKSPLQSVHSPRRRDKSCVPADKVTLYALGVTAEMAINTLRDECYQRLDQVHAMLHAVRFPASDVVSPDPQESDSTAPHTPHSTRADTSSRIPRSSRRRTAPSDHPHEPASPLQRTGNARQRSLTERLDQSVRRTADEVLSDSPAQLSFQPDNQMKLWSDGISGMCTFTFQGKTASAYCRMWTRDQVLRVSVVVGGGFQSLDEWLERTFKRHSTMLKPVTEATVALATRKHAVPLNGIPLPASIPVSASMPSLAQSAVATPSRQSHSARRIPTSFLEHETSPSSPRPQPSRRTSMLRNVSASSTYQLSDDVVRSIEKNIPDAGRTYAPPCGSPLGAQARKQGLSVSGSTRSDGRAGVLGQTSSPVHSPNTAAKSP